MYTTTSLVVCFVITIAYPNCKVKKPQKQRAHPKTRACHAMSASCTVRPRSECAIPLNGDASRSMFVILLSRRLFSVHCVAPFWSQLTHVL